MPGGATKQEHVTVGLGLRDGIRTRRPPGSGFVLHDNGGVQLSLQVLRQQSAGDIDSATGWIGNDKLDDTAGVGLSAGR